MFNDYVWQIYLKAGGESVVTFFQQNLTGDFSKDYIDTIRVCFKTNTFNQRTKEHANQ